MAISCFPSITAIPLFFPMNMNFLRFSVCMTELPTLRYRGSNTLCIPEISVSSHRIPLTVWGSLMTVLLLIFWAMLLRFHENDIESILTKDSTGNSVMEILNYLNRHYQSVTLREAAKHFGYSTSHFSTLIRESTGRTFLQIIRDIKLNQACHALRETSLNNLAICELVGYESPEHFMRTFKKTYGMTPGEYRKKNRE